MNQSAQSVISSHIPQLTELKQSSTLLNSWWDATSIIAKVNQDSLEGHGGTLLESMQNTRTRFIELQQQLNQCLLKESFNKANMDIRFKSQNLIDVLTRNLFERTADVGFLATDKHIVSYMENTAQNARAKIESRLAEYVAKYTVYDEILLIKPNGDVVANLNPDNNIQRTTDSLVGQVLTTSESYLELHKPSELVVNSDHAHLYCAKIHRGGDPDAPACGILVLSFKLRDEMERIFSTLLQSTDPSELALTDEQQKVLISSSAMKLKESAKSPSFLDALNQQKSIIHVSNTKGYQGYMGLNWLGVIHQPTNYAFRAIKANKNDSEIYAMWQDSELVSNELKAINQESKKLSTELRILTLNGKSISHRLKAHSFMPILEKLQELGDEMGQTVSNAVTEINQTALASFKTNCVFYSNLAVDIMDRNLYERANDCRWWALTPDFVEVMSMTQANDNQRQRLTNHLKYINELYTVYTNIFLFDKNGDVITASEPSELPSQVKNISTESWFLQVKSQTSTQQYSVSKFENSPFYQGKSTYIYSAAIKDQNGMFIGGIGLVFDSQPEFEAMLQDCLPLNEDGNTIENAIALYIDRKANVISSTTENWPVGSTLPLPETMTNLKNGENTDALIAIDDQHYLVGATCSSGYREYKTTGDYNNDVIALIMIKM